MKCNNILSLNSPTSYLNKKQTASLEYVLPGLGTLNGGAIRDKAIVGLIGYQMPTNQYSTQSVNVTRPIRTR